MAARALAQEPPAIPAAVKYRDGREEKVDVLNADVLGLQIRAGDLRLFLNWFELDSVNAASLKKQFLNPADLAAPGLTVAGLRITKRDGTKVEGLKLDWSSEREVLLKTSKGTVAVALSDIATIDDVTLDLRAVVAPGDLYGEILERLKPASADDWDAFSRTLAATGLAERARLAGRVAEILRHPESPEHALNRALGTLRDSLLDLELRRRVYAAQEEYLLGRLEKASEIVRDIRTKLRPNDSAIEDAARVQSELAVLQTLSMEARLVAEKARQIDAILLDAAASRSMTLADGEAIARQRVDHDAEVRTAESFGRAAGDGAVREAWERRPANLRLIHSYGESSFLRGQIEPSVGADWWRDASTANKFAYLKGLYVESARQVIRIESKNCSTCGARGDLAGKTCPACKGLGRFRVVVYR